MTPAANRLAITGLSCRYPGVENPQALARHLSGGPVAAGPTLPPPTATYADFGIPPIYRSSINRVQLDVLELARDALTEAGLTEGAFDPARTDVLFCTALAMNRAIENHARVLGVALADAYGRALPTAQRATFNSAAKQQLDKTFTATSHDKVGEMASTVAARVANCFKLRGRSLALEAGDLGGLQALLAAQDALDHHLADAVLVVGAQRIESPISATLVAALAGPAAAAAWREGACAFVLQRAPRSGARVLAWLDRVQVASAPPSTNWRGWLFPQGSITPRLWVLGGQLQQAPAGLRAPGDLVLPGRDACGYGHAVDVLSTLAQAVVGCRSIGAAVALGQGADGSAYALHVGAANTPAPATDAAPATPAATVGVLACGACFGATQGTSDYWQALRSGHASFRPLMGQRFLPRLYRTPVESPTLGYYIGRASFADAGTNEQDATAALALTAAREAQQSLAPWSQALASLASDTLVVTATNLTSCGERRWTAQALLPHIEQALTAAAEAIQLPPEAQAQGLVALREAARLPVDHAMATPALARRLTASHISRRVADLFTASGARCLALESACAGSLAAIELAVNALRSGRASLALVIGVELPVNVHDLSLCSAQRMLAPGVIATFTEAATGFTPGDGAGVLVLARAGDAHRLGLPVQALLRAVGSSTESKSVIAPNEGGQVRSMQRAFEQVEFGPEAVDFVETHGTGTLIGDEVEVRSLALAYGAGEAEGRRTPPLPLGALKAQFGHCFAAAGMASVVKTLLALRHSELPPNHYDHPLKSALRLDERGFDPLQQPRPWPRRDDRPRRAAINAFGTGGINVHLLLEEGEKA